MIGKWQTKIDIKSTYIYIIALTIYLIFLVFWKYPFYFVDLTYSIDGVPLILQNKNNLYLQFILSFFLTLITVNMFNQTFEKNSMIYIKSLPLSFFEIVIFRLIKLIFVIFIMYIPVVYIIFEKTNQSIVEFKDKFEIYADFPLINLYIPIIHCCIFVIFFIVLVMFLYSIIKNKSSVILLLVSYLAFEITFLPKIFSGNLSVFYTTFVKIDFYTLFNRTFATQIISTLIMLFIMKKTFKK